MRKYTAIFTNKRKEFIKYSYQAKDPENAIEMAKSLDAWPNVVIYDDSYSAIPTYGEMIYMNGKIVKRGCDGPYLQKSLSIYDAMRTELSYVSNRIYNKIQPLTEKPNVTQFVKDVCVEINKLNSLCKDQALKNNEPCRWL